MAAVLLRACDMLFFWFEQYSKIGKDMSNPSQQTLCYLIQEQGFYFFIFFTEDCSGGLGSKTHSSTFLIASP